MSWSRQRLRKALAPAGDIQDIPNEINEGEEIESSKTTTANEAAGAGTALPAVEDLLNPLLRAMHALGGAASNQEIEERVMLQENFTKAQLAIRTRARSGKRGKPVILRTLGYARTYLKDYGILDNPASGRWSLTDIGQNTDEVDPKEVRKANETQRLIRKAQREAKKAKVLPVEGVPDFLFQLESTLQQRQRRRPAGSYTAQLFAAGPARIAQKVGEEALEVIIAALRESRERQIDEVADLLVHTLILLVELNIPLEEVLAELRRRHETRQS